ncbi:hypothetical protein Psta_1103 [Pirellula staleyi DSM 6068]|uniref:Uncharacterized protein n=1 Tax=Pirellula staleyi (strain ATCC 27377 / DSM 6068 / ICPB 4128) TaxID=530564 RepID=D2R8G9_PIRSD|nr:hypothetical protein [Pirellula staleyi]ADB15786.1 hypothetical protein Psta_1103 [Pirellula staleyi DSM 6068]
MAKYLRYAEVRGFLRCPTPDESPANRLDYLSGCPNWFTGAAMYFRLALLRHQLHPRIQTPCPRG